MLSIRVWRYSGNHESRMSLLRDASRILQPRLSSVYGAELPTGPGARAGCSPSRRSRSTGIQSRLSEAIPQPNATVCQSRTTATPRRSSAARRSFGRRRTVAMPCLWQVVRGTEPSCAASTPYDGRLLPRAVRSLAHPVSCLAFVSGKVTDGSDSPRARDCGPCEHTRFAREAHGASRSPRFAHSQNAKADPRGGTAAVGGRYRPRSAGGRVRILADGKRIAYEMEVIVECSPSA